MLFLCSKFFSSSQYIFRCLSSSVPSNHSNCPLQWCTNFQIICPSLLISSSDMNKNCIQLHDILPDFIDVCANKFPTKYTTIIWNDKVLILEIFVTIVIMGLMTAAMESPALSLLSQTAETSNLYVSQPLRGWPLTRLLQFTMNWQSMV